MINRSDIAPDWIQGLRSSTTSRVIVLRDQSSSMAWVPRFPEIWNEQLAMLSAFTPETRVSLYSITSSIKKLEDDAALSSLATLNPDLWYGGAGGMLSGGTALGDAIIHGCQKAKQFRRRGHKGALGIFLLTDGWSKNDSHSRRLARKWLEYARRDLHVTFRMLGFVHPRSKQPLNIFTKAVNIHPTENKIVSYSSEETRDETMQTSLEKLGEEIQLLVTGS